MKEEFSEKKILRQMEGGDPEAFAQIYDKYVEAIYRFVFFKVSSRQDAEDLTSQVFTRTLEYCLKKENRIKSLKAFLYRVARNLVTDFYRSKKRGEVPLNEEIKSDPEAAVMWQADKGIEERIEGILDAEKVGEALGFLKEEYKDVIIMHYIDELSVREISSAMDKSSGAVRVLLHRAMAALKKVLAENNGLSRGGAAESSLD